jgi:hypothetical protein
VEEQMPGKRPIDRLAGGDRFTDETIAALIATGQPPLAFNLIAPDWRAPYVDPSVRGDERPTGMEGLQDNDDRLSE